MKRMLTLLLSLCLLVGMIPLGAAVAEDDWITLRVEMYDRSIAGFNVEDCWRCATFKRTSGTPTTSRWNGYLISRWEEGTILTPCSPAEPPPTSA